MNTLKQRFSVLAEMRPEITQAELARASGVKPASVNDWFSGKTRSMKATTAVKVASLYGCNPHWLATGEGNKTLTPVQSTASSDQFENIRKMENRPTVPVISWIQAGELSEVFDVFHPGEAVQWEEAMHSKPSRQSYALIVEGDSMDRSGTNPTFPPGTVLIVDPERASSAGDYVIAKDVSTQKATFKQLTTDGARWYLKPLNTAYPTIEIDDPALRVIGRVIEYRPPGGKL